MIAAFIRHLYEKPDPYLDEMAWFIWDEFHVVVSTSTLSRALRRFHKDHTAVTLATRARNIVIRLVCRAA
jgi:hypothetical protein